MHFRFFSFKDSFLIVSVALTVLASSCLPARKGIYFNGLKAGKDTVDLIAQEMAKRVFPGDRISITVVMEHPDAATLNSGVTATAGGAVGGQAGGGFGYLVDKDGYIEMVKLGKIYVAGKMPIEIAREVRIKLMELYKDVQVYCTLSGRVLFIGAGGGMGGGMGGGGMGGGAIPIMNDRLTLVEAIALSGAFMDPTAARERVWIIREQGEDREFGVININSKDIFKSPYYYLRNNDVLYMEPNRINAFLAVNAPLQNILNLGLSSLSLVLTLMILFR
jgi:polysaccharide export outer membrane protein